VNEELRSGVAAVLGAAPGQHQLAYLVPAGASKQRKQGGDLAKTARWVRTGAALACVPSRTKSGGLNFQYSSCQVYEPRA
jgi:hypothetical protein